MGKTVIQFSLNNDSIQEAINQLKAYENDMLEKVRKFNIELTKAGIEVGKVNGGVYTPYLIFTQDIKNNPFGSQIAIVMHGNPVVVEWLQADNSVKSVSVNSALMAEFGSGWLADESGKQVGAGQGTFPGQTHAFASNGWSWKDLNGNWHHSTGQAPTAPLHHAALEVVAQVNHIARRVFG